MTMLDHLLSRASNSTSPANHQKIEHIRFFRPVLCPHSNLLALPTKFTNDHGHLVPRCVVVKIAQGGVWNVIVERRMMCCYETLVFVKGWKAIKEYYGIRLFNFMVLTYDGDKTFYVDILEPDEGDLSGGTEIVYRPRSMPYPANDATGDEPHEEWRYFTKVITEYYGRELMC